MKEVLGTIQTSWPDIRIILYKKDDGQFQFFEECSASQYTDGPCIFHESGTYTDLDVAKADMIEYAVGAEDDNPIDPSSVVILEPDGGKL